MMRAGCGRWGFEGRVHVVRDATEVAQGAMIEGGKRVAKALAGQRALRVSMAGNLWWGCADGLGRMSKAGEARAWQQNVRAPAFARTTLANLVIGCHKELFSTMRQMNSLVQRQMSFIDTGRHVHCAFEQLLTHHPLVDHSHADST